MSAMTWDYDICLSCDNHTRDGEKYCSQACRLSDYERGLPNSEPATPAVHSGKAEFWDSWQMTSSLRPSPYHHYQLSSNQRAESPPASPRAQSSNRSHSTSYFTSIPLSHTSASTPQSGQRSLTLSPSRSSLSSISSSSSGASSPGLPQDVLDQLRNYSGAFDQTRAWKRRGTTA